MPGYLLDTDVMSILAPASAAQSVPPFDVVRVQIWLRAHDDLLFLSTVTLVEIQAGISQLKRRDSARRAAALAKWLDAVLEPYDSRTLPFTSSAALAAGRLLDRAIEPGAHPSFEDAASAATAALHNLTVVTQNTRHFQYFGVAFISPSAEN